MPLRANHGVRVTLIFDDMSQLVCSLRAPPLPAGRSFPASPAADLISPSLEMTSKLGYKYLDKVVVFP